MRNIGLSLLAAVALAFPAAAKEVTCADGTTAQSGRGACSQHGGVAKKAKKSKTTKAEAPKNVEPSTGAPPATAKKSDSRTTEGEAKKSDKGGGILGGLFGRRGKDTPRSSTKSSDAAKSGSPTARCKDGTMSYSAHHSGTCSGHGGVQEWLDK